MHSYDAALIKQFIREPERKGLYINARGNNGHKELSYQDVLLIMHDITSHRALYTSTRDH